MGLGVLIGTLPLYGLHLPICIATAAALRLNKVTLYLAANISNPLIAPLLVAAGIAIGEWVRYGRWPGLDTDGGQDFLDQLSLFTGGLPDLFISCLLGDAILGAALGLLAGVLTFRWARWRTLPPVGSPPSAG